MFETDDTDTMRFAIDGESDIPDEFIRDMLRVTDISPSRILQDMKDDLLVVRLSRKNDYRLLAGPEFLKLISANLYSLDDVSEFVVSKLEFLFEYMALVETFLEVRNLPRVKMTLSGETLLCIGEDLVTITTGYISDAVCRYRVQHSFGMGKQSNSLFTTQAILLVQDSNGMDGVIEVSWEGDWRPTWIRREPSSHLSEMIYTLLGATDFPKVVIDELYNSYMDAQFDVIEAPLNPNRLSGQWSYEAKVKERTDHIHMTTFWKGEDQYGANLWLNDTPLHNVNNLGGDTEHNYYFKARCTAEG